MQGEIRVTVIATGFDKVIAGTTPVMETVVAKGAPVIPLHSQRNSAAARLNAVAPRPVAPAPDIGARRPAPPPPAMDRGEQDLSDMEIPTFIRRQMD
jgi:hypothetical protein